MPYNAIAPNPSLFKDSAQDAYLQFLGQPKAGPQGVADRFALMMEAKRGGSSGTQAYLAALKATNDQQAASADRETLGKVAEAYLPTVAPNAKAGVGAAVTMAPNPYFSVNPTGAAAADAVNLDATAQGAFKDRAAGTAGLAEAGYGLPAAYVAQSLAGPLDEQAPAQVTEGYMTPKNANDAATAAAQAKSADAAVTRANREPTSSQLAKMSYTPSAYGIPVTPTFRGTPAQVAEAQAAWEKLNGGPGGATSSAPNGDTSKRYILAKKPDGSYGAVPNPNYKGHK